MNKPIYKAKPQPTMKRPTKNLLFQVVEEVWKFGISEVIANIGGNLGLFLGGSIMAGFDTIVGIASEICRNKRKINEQK